MRSALFPNCTRTYKHCYRHCIYKHIDTKPLDVVQFPYFGSLLLKYSNCFTPNSFVLYLMCCGVMLLLPIVYIYMHLFLSAIFS